MYVIFAEDGCPRWFGPEPVAGSELLDLGELVPLLPEGVPPEAMLAHLRGLLVTHRRIDGLWSPRPAPEVIPEAEAVEEPLVETPPEPSGAPLDEQTDA